MTQYPGGLSRTKTPRGLAGNVAKNDISLRQWVSSSYGIGDGRAVSSLADQRGQGSPSSTHVAGPTDNFATLSAPGQNGAPNMRTRTSRAVQDPTPVRNRRP
jgi:hypothetical protein